MHPAIRIIGIDPGLRRTGWGVVESQAIRCASWHPALCAPTTTRIWRSRLCQLHDGLSAVCRRTAPDEAAVEQTFVNKDAVATLKLGQARGIAHAGAGARGTAGRRICAQRREKGGDRRGPWRQEADPHDGEGADAEGRLRRRRCGRRAGDRDLPCASSRRALRRACCCDGGRRKAGIFRSST